MKKGIKTCLVMIGIIAGLLVILVAGFLYKTEYKYTDIDTRTSSDGRCRLLLQMKGEPDWPFGSTYGRIIARYDDEFIKEFEFEIRDDGAMLQKGNWDVAWGLAGVQITLQGSEQEDQVIQIMYDGSEEFSGYGEEEITSEIMRRYGDVKVCGKEGNLYCYDTGRFLFTVKNDLVLSDNYKMEQFRYLTDAYFAGRNRAHSYEETGKETGKETEKETEKTYTPVIPLYSASSEEKEWFCSDVTNWLLYVMKELPYEENEDLYQRIVIEYEGENFCYLFGNMKDFSEENVSVVYNDLYDFVENMVSESYAEKVTGKDDSGKGMNNSEAKGEMESGEAESEKTESEETESEETELTEETIQYYLTLEPDCTYETAGGVEYRMIPVDRACGSSFYVLVATADGGKSAVMTNSDPYLGSGGAARWISFLQDEKTGFSCLAYSGGAYGALYRTEDGGKSFETVEYPSAKVKLPDGTYYNPFVMPEKVYEKDGKLCMEAGQGADGDYHGAEGFCNGLYESMDNGKTWVYVKEVPVS